MKKKYKNIIWFHLDGIRPTKEYGDYKDRPDYLDEWAKEGIEYTNAYTAFPSTVLSISSVMVGYPSSYFARSFEDLQIDYSKFKPFFQLLKSSKYKIYSSLFYLPVRKNLKKMMFPIKKKYFPKNVKDYKYMWNSKEINRLTKSLLAKNKLSNPFLLYLQYSFTPIKGDDSLADAKKMFDFLKNEGYMDNSIVIVWADHGWPSKDKQNNRTRLQKTLEGHDLFITNDNIKVPLILIYPGCEKGLKVTTPVSTLDIAPTLLNHLEINASFGCPYFSKPLPLKNVKSPKRFFRVDTRNYFQKNKKTALHNGKYKLVIQSNGHNNFEFYDMVKDPYEKINQISNIIYKNLIFKFKNEFFNQEEDLLNFHAEFMAEKLKFIFLKNKFKHLSILRSSNNLFNSVVLNGFKLLFPAAEIKLSDKPDFSDILIVPLTNQFKPKKIHCKNYYYIDYNFNLIKKPMPYKYMIRNFKSNWKTYLTQPKVFLRKVLVLILREYEKLI